jgi:hypothetical protein
MRTTLMALGIAFTLTGCAPVRDAVTPAPGSIDQGAAWTPAARAQFYSQDQGSQLMPAAWLMALKGADGQPFMADSLSRYGYLPNREDPTTALPVGFSVAGSPGARVVGMTCAACRTREIEVDSKAYRIDGGPAFADFQSFLTDPDKAVGALTSDPAAFDTFAVSVRSGNSSTAGTGATTPSSRARCRRSPGVRRGSTRWR